PEEPAPAARCTVLLKSNAGVVYRFQHHDGRPTTARAVWPCLPCWPTEPGGGSTVKPARPWRRWPSSPPSGAHLAALTAPLRWRLAAPRRA
ncbi:MAG: hypothetical protein ACPIOQ_57085, partial [Promethearchaeia archaeon]